MKKPSFKTMLRWAGRLGMALGWCARYLPMPLMLLAVGKVWGIWAEIAAVTALIQLDSTIERHAMKAALRVNSMTVEAVLDNMKKRPINVKHEHTVLHKHEEPEEPWK